MLNNAETPVSPGTRHLHAVLARVNDGIYAVDRAWRYTYLNPAAERQIGRSAIDVLGRNVWELFPEAVDLPFFEASRRAEQEGQPVLFQAYYPPLETWFESTIYPASDGFTIVSRDITKQKRIEQELRESRERIERQLAQMQASEAQYRGLFSRVGDAILIADDVGRYVEANDAAEQLLGYSRAELLRMRVADVVAYERKWTEEEYARFKAEGQWRGRVELRRKDGEVVVAESHATVLPGEAAPRYVSVIRDISEQERVARAIRESSERAIRHLNELEAIYASSPVGLALLDRDLRFVRVNARLAEMNGVAPAEHIGKTVREIVPEVAKLAEPIFRAVVETGLPALDLEFTGRTTAAPEIERSWKEHCYPLRDPSGEITGINVIVEEITDLKRAERALHESEVRQGFLLKLSDALRPLADPIEIQAAAARVLASHLGVDRVAYGEVDGDDIVIARDHVAPGVASLAGRYRMADFGETLLSGLRAGRPVVVPHVSISTELSPPEREAYGQLGIAALTGIPLVKDGRFVANLNVHHGEPRTWSPRDLELLSETAERTWAAIERARAEAALREQAALTKAITDNASMALFLTDAAQICTYMNPAAERLTGYTLAELQGRPLHDVLHYVRPDGTPYPAEECPCRRIWPVARQVSGREIYVHKSGALYPVAFTASPITNDGRFTGAVIELEDLSVAERAERLDHLIAGAGEILASTLDVGDTLNRVAHLAVPLLADQCVVDLFGLDDDGLAVAVAHADSAREGALRALRHAHPPDLDNAHSPVARAVQARLPQLVHKLTEEQVRAIADLEANDPSIRDLIARSVVVAPLVARDQVLGTMTFGSLTAGHFGPDDLRWAEELARRCALEISNAQLYRQSVLAEEKFRRLFDAGVIGIAINRGDAIIDANDHFLEMVGCSRAELDAGAIDWRVMTPPEYAESDEAMIANLVRRGASRPTEKEFVRRDGSRVPILLGAALIKPEPLECVSFVLDLTALHEAEAERFAFVDQVAHDLKNPLAALQAQAQLLNRRARRGQSLTPDGVARLSDSVMDTCDRMVDLIEQVLDTAKLRGGHQLTLRLGPFDLLELVRERVDEAQRFTANYTIMVDSDERRIDGLWDRSRLSRVLENLLSNAIKFSPRGGDIRVEVGMDQENRSVEIAFSDHGLGIPDADLPFIFDPHRRGRNVAGRIQGSGIGLSGVKQIVEQHGGTIDVTSTEGDGSVFTIRLPIATPLAGATVSRRQRTGLR